MITNLQETYMFIVLIPEDWYPWILYTTDSFTEYWIPNNGILLILNTWWSP